MKLSDHQFAAVHTIRQLLAQARNAVDIDPSEENVKALQEATDRRDRAIRMLNDHGDYSLRQLSATFRCSKTTVRQALKESE